MLSTGIAALDTRLGGLVPGRYYLVSGAPGAGKSSVSLHFLGAGLEAGEKCAILTQDDPQDLVAQAEFLGYDFRTPAEQGQLIVLQYRLDFSHNYTRTNEADKPLQELLELLEGDVPTRFVVDSALPFVEPGGMATDGGQGLIQLLQGLSATTYVVIPGDINGTFYLPIYNRITAGAAGIFHLELVEGQIREINIRKLRQAAVNTDPFRFVVRPGMGIVECRQVERPSVLPEELQRRVVLLEVGAELPEELASTLSAAYELRSYRSLEEAFSELSGGNFAALVVALDPREPDPAVSLVRQLRKAGNGAPVLFASSQQELRSSTRAKALRAGADDYLTFELGTQEFLERMELARQRGHRVPGDVRGADNVFVQPTDDSGRPLPIDRSELQRAIRYQIERSSHPFFALVLLRSPDYLRHDAWRVLCDELRVREGDLIAELEDGRLGIYLHDISRRHVRELLARIIQANPALAAVQDVEVHSYPVDRAAVERWLAAPPLIEQVRAEQ